ncbi:MAG: hypothetical protein SVW57_02595 [Thermodesulfobacteriota bacterium]|nr:hypothetical protein [Thermodesulfobacteriota bacterium]
MERKYILCIELKHCMQKFKKSLFEEDMSKLATVTKQRNKYLKNIDSVNKTLSSFDAINKSNQMYMKEKGLVATIETWRNKIQKILGEISNINNECLLHTQNKIAEYKTQIISTQQSVKSVRNYMTSTKKVIPKFIDVKR